jgi:hypothetical protein
VTGAEVGLADRREVESLTDGPDLLEAANWWQTLRTIVVTGAEIALKVLPVLLAVLEERAAGQPPGDDQVVLTTGPLQWQVNARSLTVYVTNVDPSKRPVTVTMSPDAETEEASVTFVVPAGATQPVDQAVWARIAKGQDGSLVSISVPPVASTADDPEWKGWTMLFAGAFGAWRAGQMLRYSIPGDQETTLDFTFRRQPVVGVAFRHSNQRDARTNVHVKTPEGEVQVSSPSTPPSPPSVDGSGEIFLPFPPGFMDGDEISSGWIEVFTPST